MTIRVLVTVDKGRESRSMERSFSAYNWGQMADDSPARIRRHAIKTTREILEELVPDDNPESE